MEYEQKDKLAELRMGMTLSLLWALRNGNVTVTMTGNPAYADWKFKWHPQPGMAVVDHDRGWLELQQTNQTFTINPKCSHDWELRTQRYVLSRSHDFLQIKAVWLQVFKEGNDRPGNLIDAIKAWRYATGQTLKTAKDNCKTLLTFQMQRKTLEEQLLDHYESVTSHRVTMDEEEA